MLYKISHFLLIAIRDVSAADELQKGQKKKSHIYALTHDINLFFLVKFEFDKM